MPTWPASLPPPALNTLREKPPNNKISSAMDKGPKKMRRRTTANVRPISFTLVLADPDLVDVFDDFYNIDTFSGVEEFDYVHPRTGEACTARFGPDYEPEYAEMEGTTYSIGVELEIMP